MNLPKGAPLGFGEICVDFWDFERGVPEPLFLLLLYPVQPYTAKVWDFLLDVGMGAVVAGTMV